MSDQCIFFRPHNFSSARLGGNIRESISRINKKPYSSLISLLAEIMTYRKINACIKDAALVHLTLINWLVVNSLKAMEQRIILDID